MYALSSKLKQAEGQVLPCYTRVTEEELIPYIAL